MLNHLAAISAGFSGADLENLTNEAAILAARDNESKILKVHFEDALERIIGGVDSGDKDYSSIKQRSALVKSATTVASWYLELTDPVVKINLIPRSKQKTGAVQVIKEDVNLQTTEELLQRIQVELIGKLAEDKEFNGDVSTLSSSGLKKAYRISRAMVASYGMIEGMENVYLKEDDFRLYR
jgi:AFG3 family protein